jgi:hypothetical protein
MSKRIECVAHITLGTLTRHAKHLDKLEKDSACE